jgi:protocatechuate 3,4-dioxygenase alpha subunit
VTARAGHIASPSQTAGPFFHIGLRPVPPATVPDPIHLVVRVSDGHGDGVEDALVELWYLADAHAAGPPQATFARASTNSRGSCEFTLAPPRRDSAGPSSPHINACIFARGLLRQLYTRIYFDGDPALEHDPLLALVPPERRRTLAAQPAGDDRRSWVFEVRLQGQDETVFLAG